MFELSSKNTISKIHIAVKENSIHVNNRTAERISL